MTFITLDHPVGSAFVFPNQSFPESIISPNIFFSAPVAGIRHGEAGHPSRNLQDSGFLYPAIFRSYINKSPP